MGKRGASRSRISLAGAASLAALYFGALPAAADEDPTATFSITPQPLATALARYSEQTRIPIVAPAELVAGKRSGEVGGARTSNEALSMLLDGTGLVPRIDRSGALVLERAAPGAEAQGDSLFHLALQQAATPEPVDQAPASADAGQEADEVVVTGVRGRPRTVVESSTPIDVFSGEDLVRSSPTGVFEAMRFLVPSFNLPTRAGGGTATVIATGGLRGLNPDQTLVLVNGKRRHKTALINSVSALYNGAAGVDLNMIPASAIRRVEVLRDGAAAQYGSDAIAGVINVILKSDAEGGSASLSGGQNFDRDDGEFVTATINQGLPLGATGFLNLAYAYMDRDESNRAVPISESVDLYSRLAGGVRDPREATIDRLVTKNYGAFPQTSHNFSANAAYNLTGVELYAFGTYGARTSILNWSYRAPNTIASLPELYPNGFRPRLTIFEDDFEAAFGARGTAMNWDWDLSTNYGSDITDWENSNGLNPSLGPASPTFFEVGRLISSEWVNSLDVTRAIALPSAGELQVSFGLQHRWEGYQVEQGDAASWAAGTYVRPAGQAFAGQLQSPGAQATPGFRPDDEADAERNNFNAYLEFGWTPIEPLFLDAAVRHEYFDDAAGSQTIYKLNGRYELTDWLAFRASYNTGFRAPTLAQEYYSSTTSQFRDIDGDGVVELLLIKNLPVSSPAAIALGATPLQPETSENISVGFSLTPFDNFSLTVDAYQIDVDDRITITSTFSSIDSRIRNILVANGLSPEISGQYYTNAISTRTQGIDVVATYGLFTDFGDFNFDLGYNSNNAEITGIVANPPELAVLGNVVIFDRSRQAAVSDSLPDSKVTLSASWERGPLTVSLRGSRFGGYAVRNATNPAQDYSVGARWITDLEFRYAVTDHFEISAGANNLFNEYPEEINPPGATNGANMYDTFAPFGFTGGNWFVRSAYTW